MDEVIYDNVCDNYDYSWTNSKLYQFLSKNYMLNDMEIILKDGTIIKVMKYNICGSTKNNPLLKVYETNGNTNKPIHEIKFKEIKKIKGEIK